MMMKKLYKRAEDYAYEEIIEGLISGRRKIFRYNSYIKHNRKYNIS